MDYVRCGSSGLRLSRLSYGIWHGFCDRTDDADSRALIHAAIDAGITHYDAANVYGPPNGHAEEVLGKILRADFSGHRDDLVIATKAGYGMWEGPYGKGGSRKHMISSAEQSLRRLGLDYVDIFYSHAPDEDTPFEETAQALADLVRMGKALYIGISNYNGEQTIRMATALRAAGVPLLIHQVENSMLVPFKAIDVLPRLQECGAGALVFAPLAGGRLTDKYLHGIPASSRAAREHYLRRAEITEAMVELVVNVREIALAHDRTLPQLALQWAMQHESVCSALIGASRPEQIRTNCADLQSEELSPEEGSMIRKLLERYHDRAVATA